MSEYTSMERIQMETEIGRTVAESIAKFHAMGFDTGDVMSCYVQAIGASMSVLYAGASSSKVKEVCGEWGKNGFQAANGMGLGI